MSDNPFLKHLLGLLAKIGNYSQPPNIWLIIAVTLVVVAVMYPARIWVVLRHGITIIHEGGHAFVGLLHGTTYRGYSPAR